MKGIFLFIQQSYHHVDHQPRVCTLTTAGIGTQVRNDQLVITANPLGVLSAHFV
jgi:hypothetical protein